MPLRVLQFKEAHHFAHISTQAFSSGEIDLQVSTLIQTMGFLGLGATEKPCPVAARAPDTEDRASSSATRQPIGSIIGTVDIAESEDSYLFQVSLPAVRRDRSFSCELDMDGEVVISGMIATGEKMIHRLGKVFARKTENLYQPGPFSLSFQLPGPVDPVQSNLTFHRDAIFEGVVKKQMND